jgi:nucleoside-diphosphate-sugar epimerase
MNDAHVLVAGGSGLVGSAAADHFAFAEWKVTTLSRRRGSSAVDHISLDLSDGEACKRSLPQLGVTHVIYAALNELPDLESGWISRDQIDFNLRMLRNLIEAVDDSRSKLKQVIVVHGPKAYGTHVAETDLPNREDRSERRDIPNFYWDQEDYLRLRQRGRPWDWTILRPSMVLGQALGSPMNIILGLGVYGAILRDRGEPLHYPATGNFIAQPTDTRIIAQACQWAFGSARSANQIFNVTNGEVASLRSLWPSIAAALGMKTGPDRPISFVQTFADRSVDWMRISRKFGINTPPLDALVGQSFQTLDFVFRLGNLPGPPRGIMSTIKIRAAGFYSVMSSEDTFAHWLAKYQQNGILPAP